MKKDEVLKVAGEPAAKVEDFTGDRSRIFTHKRLPVGSNPYTEAQLLAVAEAMKADGWRQCAVGQRTSQFCGQLEAEKAKAYAAGEEAMRERAAKECAIEADGWHGVNSDGKSPYADYKLEACEECALVIRALPITTNTEGEQ